MSITSVLQLLSRIHAANGELETIRGHFGNYQRAQSYNPRNSESWDIFDMQDDRLVRIARSCDRAATLFERMSRTRTTVRGNSSDLSRLFANWAAAYAAHGEDSRQVRTAKTEFAMVLLNAGGELVRIEREADEALEVLRKYKKFYGQQQGIFGRIGDLARRFVSLWPTSSNGPKAFAIMQSSEDIEHLSRRVLSFIIRATSNLRTQKRAAGVERRQLQVWQRWLANDRNAQQDVASNRAPN